MRPFKIFGKYVLIYPKQYKIETQSKTRKSYVTYQMAPMPVTLSDLQGHLSVAWLFKCNSSTIYAAFYKISANSLLAEGGKSVS